jgi:hypothetical protein
MARKPTAADLLALDLQRQLAALNAQPSPVKVVENIINPPAVATYEQKLADYEKAKSQFSEIKDPLVRATLEGLAKSADTQTTRVADMAEALGYQVNPRTGVVEPKTVVASGGGNQIQTNLDNKLSTAPTLDTKKIDAIAAISALLSSYGLGDLSGAVTEAVQKGYTSDTIQLIMQDPNSKDPLAVAFQTRFSGNKARFAAGKAVLSPGEYLAAERSYTQVLQSYGVASMATKDKLSSFIGNDISAAEVADRVGLAIDRVKNADPFVKAALAEYYPTLNQADIVSAVLDPAEGLPALKRKIQIGEIGGAAAIQGLKTGLASTSGMAAGLENVTSGALGAEALASFGITQEEARKGYQTVASIAPRAEFLSSISTGEDYTRLQAEQEAFLGLASAKRARESISAQEEGRFKGQSGLTKTTLTQSGAGQY